MTEDHTAHHYRHYQNGVYNATMDVDFGEVRRRAGNLASRDLQRLGEDSGWSFNASRGKGSHGMLLKRGQRVITIPRKLNDRNLVLSIITLIERGTGASND